MLRRATLALALSLQASGCLRFGYDAIELPAGRIRDAGMDAAAGPDRRDAGAVPDAQLSAADGSAAAGGDAGSGMLRVGDAGSDASASDASTQDAQISAADSGSPTTSGDFADCMQAPGVLFCDGFEAALPWVPKRWDGHAVMNGSEERSVDEKYAGEASAHMSTLSNSSDTAARLEYQSLGGRTSGEIWLRYYYFLPRSVIIDSYFTASVLGELSSPFAGVSLLIRPGQLQIKSTLTGNKSIGFTFPRDRWVCIEHRLIVSATDGYFEIYVDKASTLESNKANTVPGAGWGRATIGIHDVASNQGPVNVYVDNVVVSTTRYGCDSSQ